MISGCLYICNTVKQHNYFHELQCLLIIRSYISRKIWCIHVYISVEMDRLVGSYNKLCLAKISYKAKTNVSQKFALAKISHFTISFLWENSLNSAATNYVATINWNCTGSSLHWEHFSLFWMTINKKLYISQKYDAFMSTYVHMSRNG